MTYHILNFNKTYQFIMDIFLYQMWKEMNQDESDFVNLGSLLASYMRSHLGKVKRI